MIRMRRKLQRLLMRDEQGHERTLRVGPGISDNNDHAVFSSGLGDDLISTAIYNDAPLVATLCTPLSHIPISIIIIKASEARQVSFVDIGPGALNAFYYSRVDGSRLSLAM